VKANKGQIERALDAPPADIRIFLLYGPDESGSAALAKRLERAMGPQAERIDLDGTALKADPARLADEAASFSMFGDRRWIRVTPVGDEAAPAVEALLEAPQAGNPVVAVAGALRNTSKLVKLCLDSRAAMACISYVPDARDAEQIAVGIARERGLRLPAGLARRIVGLTGGDRALMSGEIEKIALYLDAAPDRPAEATAEALNALSADSVEEDSGALVNAVLGGDIRAMNREVVRLGANLVGALRPLQNRAILIADIRTDFDRIGRVEDAVKAAGKAVFWKDEKAVQRQVRLWDAPGIARVIARLGAAERASRSGRGSAETLVAHELLAIARQAARER
jgi:DNA polymerase-3 subunit delta